MSDKSNISDKKTQTDQRAKRRSEQLRANLMRRKAQIRSRRSGEEDARSEGLPAAHEPSTSEDADDKSDSDEI